MPLPLPLLKGKSLVGGFLKVLKQILCAGMCASFFVRHLASNILVNLMDDLTFLNRKYKQYENKGKWIECNSWWSELNWKQYIMKAHFIYPLISHYLRFHFIVLVNVTSKTQTLYSVCITYFLSLYFCFFLNRQLNSGSFSFFALLSIK